MHLADLGAEVIRVDNPWVFPATAALYLSPYPNVRQLGRQRRPDIYKTPVRRVGCRPAAINYKLTADKPPKLCYF